MKYLFVVLFCWFNASFVKAQDKPLLSLKQYIDIVLRNHPLIHQARLLPEYAKNEVRKAKGAFDPVIAGSVDQKKFEDKEYYTLITSTLKVPTWIPLDPKIMIDRNTGDFLNPQNGIADQSFQINGGISIPIGRGLFIDERRAVLQQAKSFQDIAYADQIKIANYLLLGTITDYYDWAFAYQELRLIEQSIIIAQTLFDRVLLDYSFGEAAVVDTVQAKITLQSRIAEFYEVKLKFQNAGYRLSTHLWSDDQLPLELEETTVPDTTFVLFQLPDDGLINEWLEWSSDNHPTLLKINGKMDQLETEYRLNREYLKPQIDLSYNLIDAPVTPNGEWSAPNWNESYKLGVDVYFPIFLRKERGKLAQTGIKIQENDLELKFQNNYITNTILQRIAEIETSKMLVSQFDAIAGNYELLLQAEILNLETGESDLFKINIQQDKFIESRMKYLKTFYNLEKSKIKLRNDAGLPFLLLVDL
jgi:outer membrane protein TolC